MVKLLLKLPTVLQWISIPPSPGRSYLLLTCLRVIFMINLSCCWKGPSYIIHLSMYSCCLPLVGLGACVFVKLIMQQYLTLPLPGSLWCHLSPLQSHVTLISSTQKSQFLWHRVLPWKVMDLMDVPPAHGWLSWAPFAAQGEKQSQAHHTLPCTCFHLGCLLCGPTHITLF